MARLAMKTVDYEFLEDLMMGFDVLLQQGDALDTGVHALRADMPDGTVISGLFYNVRSDWQDGHFTSVLKPEAVVRLWLK